MYLEKILDQHRARSHADPRKLDDLISAARKSAPARGFARRLRDDSRDKLAVIAEIKRRSPSKGDLNPDLQPATLAAEYQQGGASCISVLTDLDFFGGSTQDLQAARNAVSLPVLRKDFTVSMNDICDAKIMNADCLLLIVAALDRRELAEFHELSVDIGLDVLVETHDAAELDVALEIGATMIGANQRDLKTFQVDSRRAEQLVKLMPSNVLRVAESGVKTRDDAQRLRDAGYQAILVGESLVTSGDKISSLRDLQV